MPVVAPIEPYASDPQKLLALAIWREARGTTLLAKIGVANVVRNRCAMSPAQGFKSTVEGNILHPWAFSSFMEGDPNATKYPAQDDPSWNASLAAARSTEPDPSLGSVFYFSPPLTEPPHAWGAVEHRATIGALHFYGIHGELTS